MSRRVLEKLSFHSLLCLSGPSPPFLGTGCQPGCLQSWQESSCGSESTPMPADGVGAARFRTLPGEKLPTLQAADPQPFACPAWQWLKLNIQPRVGGKWLLWVFLRFFFGKHKGTRCFLPQGQIVICLGNEGARENDISQEFQELQVCHRCCCTCVNLPLQDFSQHHPCRNKV